MPPVFLAFRLAHSPMDEMPETETPTEDPSEQRTLADEFDEKRTSEDDADPVPSRDRSEQEVDTHRFGTPAPAVDVCSYAGSRRRAMTLAWTGLRELEARGEPVHREDLSLMVRSGWEVVRAEQQSCKVKASRQHRAAVREAAESIAGWT
jgi:hypothetical protein